MALFDMIADMFSLTFMVRAIVVGLLVSLCAALLGVNLILKRYAMIGTGLSHVGFAAMAIAGVIDLALPADLAPLAISMPVVIGTAFLLLRLNESNKINGDSAVALISTSGLAIGVIVVSLTTGLTLHICNIMFGSIFAMRRVDMYLSIALSVVVIGLFVVFYKQLFAITYDENFAKATGVKVEIYKSLLAILTAVTVVLGMRMMGALLIASLTLFPALSAMRICKRFLSVVIAAAVIGVGCFFIGMLFSFGLDLPPGASVVGVNLAVFILFCAAGFLKKRGIV
ncbi:MAG: metal ABC transporter permease [Defluviitaleaceae bacterium]|nr:metal ABC transporter permease [Defluviitaleaceae bacterium]